MGGCFARSHLNNLDSQDQDHAWYLPFWGPPSSSGTPLTGAGVAPDPSAGDDAVGASSSCGGSSGSGRGRGRPWPELVPSEEGLLDAPHAWLGVGAAATLPEARRAFRALYARAPSETAAVAALGGVGGYVDRCSSVHCGDSMASTASGGSGAWERPALRRALAAFEAQRRAPASQLLQREGGWHVERGLSQGSCCDHVACLTTGTPPLEVASARELARLALSYDLRRGLAPAPAPLFCVATDSASLARAAAIAVGVESCRSLAGGCLRMPSSEVPLPPSPHQRAAAPPAAVTATVGQGQPAGEPEPAVQHALAPIAEVPTPLLCLIFARFLPAAAPGGGAADVARTCSTLAELVRSGDFWAAALAMRYRVVPSARGLASHLGRAPSHYEVPVPDGLLGGADPGFQLMATPPLSPALASSLGLAEVPRGHAALPAIFLAMTEKGPSLVLLEPVRANTLVLEFAGEVSPLAATALAAPASPRTSRRSFFGRRHEVWLDILEGREAASPPGPPTLLRPRQRRTRLCVSAARAGSEARWLRFCGPGEEPNLRLEVVFDATPPLSGGPQAATDSVGVPRLLLVAEFDLPAFSELLWVDLHFCSAPRSRASGSSATAAAAAGGTAEVAAPTALGGGGSDIAAAAGQAAGGGQ
eukprot:CAMPEP_0203917856 /NCGR_PEP_ID=MMETSP0359-20131031/58430_1 /ASSEMBLY_ACC=CAM_ASM_000338 /TAXON_ID=268821 /ORGANISM="Scrippsiella Hangoei, Strain SHTV-5" /LENGTH=646 /DNA_ID=CAMNT_0050844835 /DNA_START=26 /DNA_END=1963 /DNA_ORIENTATION=-